jgi:hypothetical protein
MLRLKCIEWNGDGTFQTMNVGFEDEDPDGVLIPATR